MTITIKKHTCFCFDETSNIHIIFNASQRYYFLFNVDFLWKMTIRIVLAHFHFRRRAFPSSKIVDNIRNVTRRILRDVRPGRDKNIREPVAVVVYIILEIKRVAVICIILTFDTLRQNPSKIVCLARVRVKYSDVSFEFRTTAVEGKSHHRHGLVDLSVVNVQQSMNV